MIFSQFFEKKLQTPPERLLFSAIPGGLPQGKLIEMSSPVGGGKTETLLKFFGENPSIQVAWIEMGTDIYPCAFSERGVDLSRILFVEAEKQADALWSAHQILKSQIFGAVVLSQRNSTSFIQANSNRQTGMHPQVTPSISVTPHTHNAIGPCDSRSIELRGRGPANGRPAVLPAAWGEIELRRLQIAAEKSGTQVFLLSETPSTSASWPINMQLEIQLGEIRILKGKGDAWGRNIG